MRRTWPSERRRSRRVLLAGGGLVLVVAVAVAFVVVRSGDDGGPTFCAGVGMVGAPVADSSDEAFRAWLAENPNEPPLEDWTRGDPTQRRVSKRRSVAYETKQSRRYWQVSVGTGGLDADGDRLSVDEWQVDGACTGSWAGSHP